MVGKGRARKMGRVIQKVLQIIIILGLIGIGIADAQAVTISLVPNSSTVAFGEQFTVDAVLNNPSSEGLVGIGIYVLYDSNLLTVLDTDAGNWITTGTNILDGPYHNPFDLPGDPDLLFPNGNDADEAGKIKWDARRSFSDLTDISPSGTFATITFQAKSSVGSTSLAFAGPGTGAFPDTYVMNADSQYILTGTTGADINVVPEPASLILIASGLLGLGFYKSRRKEDSIK